VEIKSELSMTLPAISICSTNFFQTKAASDYALSFISNLSQQPENNEKKNDTRPPPGEPSIGPKNCDPSSPLTNLSDLKKAFNLPKPEPCLSRYNIIIGDLKENISSPQTSDELKQSFGLNRSQLILECKIGGLNADCRPEQIVWFFDSNYGNCFIINRYII
jgi:hypothetical protein